VIPSPHGRAQALVGAFMLGEGGARDRERALAHLGRCAGCREALEGARRSVAPLRGLGKTDRWAPSVRSEVAGRVALARRARVRHVACGIGAATVLSFALSTTFVARSLAPIDRMLRTSAAGRFAIVRVRSERDRLGPLAPAPSAGARGRWETRLALLASAEISAAARRGSLIERELFYERSAAAELPRPAAAPGYRLGALGAAAESPVLRVDLAAYAPER